MCKGRPAIAYFAARKPPLPPTPSSDNPAIELIPTQQVHQYHATVRDRLQDAIDSPILTCGMAPLDHDDPCFSLFHCNPSLECDTHVESKFYTSRIEQTRMEMCCHCAGTMLDFPIDLHPSQGAWRAVLHSVADMQDLHRQRFPYYCSLCKTKCKR